MYFLKYYSIFDGIIKIHSIQYTVDTVFNNASKFWNFILGIQNIMDSFSRLTDKLGSTLGEYNLGFNHQKRLNLFIRNN